MNCLKTAMVTIDNMVEIDFSWTLFLDRDGIINERPELYITEWKNFIFKQDFIDSIKEYRRLFGRIIVITNQQGVAKGLMSKADAADIHQRMIEATSSFGGRIDHVYFCPHLAEDGCSCRKPLTGMGIMAKNDYPEIDFNKSVMIGDTGRDMIFGRSLGMKTVYIPSREEDFSGYDYYAADLNESLKIFKTGK